MYIHNKEKLAGHPMFEQAVMLSEMTTNSVWESLYRDPDGELSIIFKGKLHERQIKIILMHFKDLIDGDTDVDNISCKPHVDYCYHQRDSRGYCTQIFTPDGYCYHRF